MAIEPIICHNSSRHHLETIRQQTLPQVGARSDRDALNGPGTRDRKIILDPHSYTWYIYPSYTYIHIYIYTYLVYGCFLIILVPMKYLQPTSSHDFLVQNRAALLPPELSGWRAAHHWSPANFMPPNRWCWESLSYMVCSSDVNED